MLPEIPKELSKEQLSLVRSIKLTIGHVLDLYRNGTMEIPIPSELSPEETEKFFKDTLIFAPYSSELGSQDGVILSSISSTLKQLVVSLKNWENPDDIRIAFIANLKGLFINLNLNNIKSHRPSLYDDPENLDTIDTMAYLIFEVLGSSRDW